MGQIWYQTGKKSFYILKVSKFYVDKYFRLKKKKKKSKVKARGMKICFHSFSW